MGVLLFGAAVDVSSSFVVFPKVRYYTHIFVLFVYPTCSLKRTSTVHLSQILPLLTGGNGIVE